MVSQAEFDELHAQYHLMAETVEVGSQILAALIWQFGVGDEQERTLILDGPLPLRTVSVAKIGDVYTLTAHDGEWEPET